MLTLAILKYVNVHSLAGQRNFAEGVTEKLPAQCLPLT